MPKLIDLTGRKFTRLTVICRYGKHYEGRNIVWKCRCDCGKLKFALGHNLRRGSTTSCGCRRRDEARRRFSKKPYESLYNTFCSKARTNAGQIVSLTYKDFLNFVTISTCHYCSGKVSWTRFNLGRGSSGYNLDRKDSTKGYSKENCVVCCRRCNQGKSNVFSYEEWLAIGKFMRRNPKIFKRK